MNRLEKDYNSPLSSKIKDPDFDSVVIKIQNDEISNITAEEHNACDNLRIDKMMVTMTMTTTTMIHMKKGV